MVTTESQAAYESLRAEATRLAGHPGDIAQRVAVLHGIFTASGGNHTFPQVALHGALWASTFFETTGKLGKAIQYRYIYSPRERAYRMALLNRFAEGFKAVNRSVFIDTYTNYEFSRRHGRAPGAETLIHPALLEALNTMHAATAAGRRLPAAQRRQLFVRSLRWEQEITVAPGVKAEIARFDCPILAALCLKPFVRFAYFPAWRYLFFKDFSNPTERIAKAVLSYDLAERCGWQRVQDTMRAYDILPAAFFRDPRTYVDTLKTRLLADATP